jgi:hypothetical protein
VHCPFLLDHPSIAYYQVVAKSGIAHCCNIVHVRHERAISCIVGVFLCPLKPVVDDNTLTVPRECPGCSKSSFIKNDVAPLGEGLLEQPWLLYRQAWDYAGK